MPINPENTTDQTSSFGEWLKDRMNQMDITVEALAAQIERGERCVFRWRNGTHHPVGKIQATLARILGVSVSEIRQRVFKERRAAHASTSTKSVPA